MSARNHWKIYDQVYTRLALYVSISFVMEYIKMFKGLPHDTIAAWSPMDKTVSVAELVLPVLLVIRTFLDKASGEAAEKKAVLEGKPASLLSPATKP